MFKGAQYDYQSQVPHSGQTSILIYVEEAGAVNKSALGCLFNEERVAVRRILCGTSLQARVSAHGCRDPGKPDPAEHFSRGGRLTVSVKHIPCL